jgi:hypothetical protein
MNQSTGAPGPAGVDLLGIYLNDHLAGATGGVELARRIVDSHRRSRHGEVLARVAAEVEADYTALREVMTSLGIPVRRYKAYTAWLAEKAGRLKLNGRLLSQSPLTMLVELDTMLLAVAGKAAGWRALRQLADRDRRLDAGRLDSLIERADRQTDTLEQVRRQVVGEIFAST